MNLASRVGRVADWLGAQGAGAAFILDNEGHRDRSLRYLTGHPSDACLFVLATGRTVLVPWDVNLAARSTADEIIPFSDFGRDAAAAVAGIAGRERITRALELPASISYTLHAAIGAVVPSLELRCREDGIEAALGALRARKDHEEIGAVRATCRLTNDILGAVIHRIERAEEFMREVEVALFVEREALERGAEGMSFETIAAGPGRSFAIHAIPGYGGGRFGGRGLSILDFGLLVEGYPSDVTLTVAAGALSERQREMVGLVEEAYRLAIERAAPGRPIREIAKAVDELFGAHGWTMPHSLGHGMGLDIHEAPRVNGRERAEAVLEPGMVITIEPGLYDPGEGGVRKENDLLVTEKGVEVLTASRVVRTAP